MIQSPLDDRTPPITPQLAMRVAIIGTCALAMFAVIFFRLWFLQVLSGSQYVAEAQTNILRKIPVPAPRGEILSSNGTALVRSVQVPAVEIETPDLPVPITPSTILSKQPAGDYPLYDKLARLLGMSTKPSSCKYTIYESKGPQTYDPRLAPIPCDIAQGLANTSYANVTIKTDVSADVRDYIAERQAEFQGVISEQVYLRQYPYNDLAAQVFGTVGPLTSAEEGTANFKGNKATDIVGQSGLEWQYNQYLSGTDGYYAVKVNSQNEFQGQARSKAPQQGDNLQLSLDLALEQTGDKSLANSIASNAPADSGAFVAMDPENGQIYGMGSLPSYNPSLFTHPISQATYNKDFLDNPAAPLVNRAIDSPLPDGSTFKVITATAALEGGVWGLNEVYDDNGEFCFPGESSTTPGACLHNSGQAAYGAVNLETAIQDSVDTFFYNLGDKLNSQPIETYAHPNGGELQKWAKAYGIGETTGVDLPGEAAGTLPSPGYLSWRTSQEMQCETATGEYKYTNGQGLFSSKPEAGYHHSPKQPAGCGIMSPDKADDTWSVGDNVNTAVGQGYDQVTPLQLAVVYAALANGGNIVTPHIGEDIQTKTGQILQKFNPGIKRHLDINPIYRQAILTGLRDAATSGTSADVMGNFPYQVYGKTGTAQEGTAEQIATNTETDYAWYACFVPATATSKPIVVVVSVEKGGFGDVAAAPVARQILSQWFTGKPGPYVTGTSTDT